MNPDNTQSLTSSQFTVLSDALHQAVRQASVSLAKWLQRPSSISIDSVEQIPLPQAPQVLGDDETPICCCTVEIQGRFTGELILAFDDASGLALADTLLHHPAGTATEWDELEQSAALETANIVCCAYLNELARVLPEVAHRPQELLPSPPTFRRDFAACVLQSALVGQAVASDFLFIARAAFQIEGASVNWNLVFVPDAESMANLRQSLGE